ncbi:MAG: MBOAT family O-acyltransferase [Desulfovibrionaceae bacterium]
MNFVTLQFVLFFLPALWCCWYTRRWHFIHLVTLLVCNYFFYSHAGLWGLAVLVLVSTTAYFSAILLSRRQAQQKRKRIVFFAVSLCVVLLALFKYHEFLLETAQNICVFLGFPSDVGKVLENNFVSIAGISFFTFQAISYIVDVYRRDIQAAYGFWEVFAYVSFFPTVMSGPIMRAPAFMEQLDRPLRDTVAFQEGFLLILSGLFKKVVLSSYLSEHIVRHVFAAPENYSSVAVAIGVYGYAIQIYCDFSGYTDLALGIGRLMGYKLPPNFKSPYLACSLKDFWHRWHISLSEWLKDYVYISLGGNRSGNIYVNNMLTMLIGGLWHGSSWTFVIWGGLHGLGLVLQVAFTALRRKNATIHPQQTTLWKKAITWMLTFHVVCLLWVFFRADSLERAFAIFQKLTECSMGGEGFPLFAIFAICLGFFIQVWGQNCYMLCTRLQAHLPWQAQGVAVGMGVTIIMAMGPDGVLPFIYFRF